MVFVWYVKENINIVFFMHYTWNCRDVFTPFENWRNADVNTRVLDACGGEVQTFNSRHSVLW